MFEFRHTFEGTEVVVRLNEPHATHSELAELFNQFLLGCGYHPSTRYDLAVDEEAAR